MDDIRMRWIEAGSGVPVVLVHGLPSGPGLWRGVLPRLAGARVLAWEMVGYAGSIPSGEGREIGVAWQAEYLLRWLDALGLDRVILGGHDLGGGVVQIAAMRRPGRCAGLLLTNCIGYDNWPVPEAKLLRAAGPLLRRLPRAVIKAGVFRPLMALGHDDASAAARALDLHWRPYAAHGAGAALARQLEDLNVRDTLEIAPRLPTLRHIPARVVWGAGDRWLPVRWGERLACDLQAPLTRVPGGRHFLPEDHPEEVVLALRELVALA